MCYARTSWQIDAFGETKRSKVRKHAHPRPLRQFRIRKLLSKVSDLQLQRFDLPTHLRPDAEVVDCPIANAGTTLLTRTSGNPSDQSTQSAPTRRCDCRSFVAIGQAGGPQRKVPPIRDMPTGTTRHDSSMLQAFINLRLMLLAMGRIS